MSFQVSRILKHCYQLPSLASSLEIATQPYARAVVSTLGMDFRRGFAEVGGKSSPQPEASNPDSAAPEETAGSAKALENGLGQISQPRASSREPDPCDAPNLQAPTSAADEAKPPFASGGVLDFGELLDNTFKMLKSRTTPLEVENPAQSVSLLKMLSESVKAYISILFTTNTIETGHSDEEFLVGAGDAFQTVFEMVHEKDWLALEEMVYPGALKGFKQTFEEHARHGLQLNFLPARDVEAQHAWYSIMHGSIIKRIGGTTGDEDQPYETSPPTPAAAQAGTATATLDPPVFKFDITKLLSHFAKPDPTKYYQIATVCYKAKLEAEVKKEEDGQLVLKSTDNRRQIWLFARGPLPSELPTRELQLRWKLLAML